MLLLLTVVNSLAFAGYCYVAWFITSPHFIEAFYIEITGVKYEQRSKRNDERRGDKQSR